MKNFPKSLTAKLETRIQNNALRQLPSQSKIVDFASNDYLGFSQSETIFHQTHQFLMDNDFVQNGATGSRLLSGNHKLYALAENHIAQFHLAETALIFNSGYDANVGLFSAVPQKGDFILYDELCHASIRDGIQLSNAKSYKYRHNDYEDLELLLQRFKSENTEIYIATESVFSMDGDASDIEQLVRLSIKHNVYLIVDEAHALGVFGAKGEGLTQPFHNQIFARIMTFGKGLGSHGAAVLGSQDLKNYLVNFARSFIYTTALSPHAVATILVGYQHLENEKETIQKLRENIVFFNQQKQLIGMKPLFVRSKSAIQCAIIPGNEKVKNTALQLQKHGFDVKAILSPTIPEGQERLRFCLHSYNSEQEISDALTLLHSLLF